MAERRGASLMSLGSANGLFYFVKIWIALEITKRDQHIFQRTIDIYLCLKLNSSARRYYISQGFCAEIFALL